MKLPLFSPPLPDDEPRQYTFSNDNRLILYFVDGKLENRYNLTWRGYGEEFDSDGYGKLVRYLKQLAGGERAPN